jgi:hypothetical protein
MEPPAGVILAEFLFLFAAAFRGLRTAHTKRRPWEDISISTSVNHY